MLPMPPLRLPQLRGSGRADGDRATGSECAAAGARGSAPESRGGGSAARRRGGGLLLAGVAAAIASAGHGGAFVAPTGAGAGALESVRCRGLAPPSGLVGESAAAAAAGPWPAAAPVRDSGARRRQRRGGRIARRLFDTGSFFGVGLPEALIVGLLGWFLLGPEELYRLSKQVGSWLGELRTYVGQAAKQYESALDDESTRKAIEGIRRTQQTFSEVSSSWSSVASSLRDPLQLGSVFESSMNRYTPMVPKDEAKDAEKAKEKDGATVDAKVVKASSSKSSSSSTSYPDLDNDGEEEETLEELESKRIASRKGASDLWYGGGKKAASGDGENPGAFPGYLEKLDRRLEELDDLADQLEALRAGIQVDRADIRASMLEAKAAAALTAASAAEGATEVVGLPVAAAVAAAPADKVPVST